jgi:hypothetical protein
MTGDEESVNSGDCDDDCTHDEGNNITESLLRNTEQDSINTKDKNSKIERLLNKNNPNNNNVNEDFYF